MQVLVFVTPPCILLSRTVPQRTLQGTFSVTACTFVPAGRQGQKHEHAGNMNKEVRWRTLEDILAILKMTNYFVESGRQSDHMTKTFQFELISALIHN